MQIHSSTRKIDKNYKEVELWQKIAKLNAGAVSVRAKGVTVCFCTIEVPLRRGNTDVVATFRVTWIETLSFLSDSKTNERGAVLWTAPLLHSAAARVEGPLLVLSACSGSSLAKLSISPCDIPSRVKAPFWVRNFMAQMNLRPSEAGLSQSLPALKVRIASSGTIMPPPAKLSNGLLPGFSAAQTQRDI